MALPSLQVEIIGRSRSLLRLGGDGFLTFHFESAGGRPGRLDPRQIAANQMPMPTCPEDLSWGSLEEMIFLVNCCAVTCNMLAENPRFAGGESSMLFDILNFLRRVLVLTFQNNKP